MPSKEPTKSKYKNRDDDRVFTEAERAAVAATARERKAATGRTPAEERAEGLRDLRDSLARMPDDDRAMGQRIHEIVTDAAPALVPKTYYGMPAYATEGKNGKVIAFFKPKSKFKVRYSTFGFQPDAKLDDGQFWDRADPDRRVTDRRPHQKSSGLRAGRRRGRAVEFQARGQSPASNDVGIDSLGARSSSLPSRGRSGYAGWIPAAD
jgi:uncharacterized protein YdhG (YjbR/CyaY superfamily)